MDNKKIKNDDYYILKHPVKQIKKNPTMKWLSTKDHEPPLNVWCLTNADNYDTPLLVSQWNGKQWWHIEDSASFCSGEVTHFLVPEPIEKND